MRTLGAATVLKQQKENPNIPVRGDKMIRKLFLELCRYVHTPLSYKAYHLYSEGRIAELLAIKFDPFFYEWNGRDDELRGDYQIVAFFKKYQDFDLGIDREKAAFEKWLGAEAVCHKVNSMFRRRWEGVDPPQHFPVEEILHLARWKITDVLSTIKPDDIQYVRDRCNHGPGADTRLRKSVSSAYEKYRTQGEITPACVSVFDELYSSEPDIRNDFAHRAKLGRSSKLAFVPKTAQVDRAICVEPRWNVYFQLGFGSLISQRLSKIGIDIKNQSRNQEAARKALSNGYSTIDLSSASDSIAINLVIDLFSNADPLWLDWILKSRCHSTEYRGKTIRLEKISSMGNGYTFPLETLIFYAFAWATCRFLRIDTRPVTVYGDDIIVPKAAFSQLVEALSCFGFTTNVDKSYASGSFFESCGKDYYKGKEVRPFFVKKKIETLAHAFILYNQVIEWGSTRLNAENSFISQRLFALAEKCIASEIPPRSRYRGPRSLGGCLHSPFDLCLPERAGCLEGYYIRNLTERTGSKDRFSFEGHLYSKLSSDVNCRNRVIDRGKVSWRLTRSLVARFDDLIIV